MPRFHESPAFIYTDKRRKLSLPSRNSPRACARDLSKSWQIQDRQSPDPEARQIEAGRSTISEGSDNNNVNTRSSRDVGVSPPPTQRGDYSRPRVLPREYTASAYLLNRPPTPSPCRCPRPPSLPPPPLPPATRRA